MNMHTPSHTSRRTLRRLNARRLAAAFSLIEVLIAILILALGLLGLGAVIPVVVREQRIAAETTRAVIALNNAKAYLRTRPDLNRLIGDGTGFRGAGGSPSGSPAEMGFGVWLEDDRWSDGQPSLWELPTNAYQPDGSIRLGREGRSVVTIPQADRFWPHPSSGAEPQLVWDIIGRRIETADQIPQVAPARTLQLAVFVRRIDSGIRVPPGQKRLQVLTDPGARRVAVGADPQGRPTGDGSGVYSAPRALDVQVDAPNILRSNEAADPGEHWSLPGQRLVDNLGNVYRVLRRDPDDPSRVVIDPPVIDSERAKVVQVVFVPQIPAAVEVFQITIPREGARSPNGAGAGMSPWFGQVGGTP